MFLLFFVVFVFVRKNVGPAGNRWSVWRGAVGYKRVRCWVYVVTAW